MCFAPLVEDSSMQRKASMYVLQYAFRGNLSTDINYLPPAMWKYGEADIREISGYDAATFIRICAFGKVQA